MSHVLRAEATAVRILNDAIGRFAERLRTAATAARLEARVAGEKAQRAVAERTQAFERAERERAQAQQALGRCREDCGGLQQALARATAMQQRARAKLDRARQAQRTIEIVTSELLRSLLSAESTVLQQAGASDSSLRTLEERLRAIAAGTPDVSASPPPHPNRLQSAITTMGVAAEVAVTAMGFGQSINAVSQGHVFGTGRRENAIEIQQEAASEGQQLWADHRTDHMREHRGDWGTPEHDE